MKKISPQELKKRSGEPGVVVVDVRQGFEYQSGHLDSALHLPLDTLHPSQIPSDTKTLVLYCHSGKRSLEACKKILQHNPQYEVCSLEGGYQAYSSPCKTGCRLSVERQTQILAGSLLLVSMSLGGISSAFHWIPCVVGAGLCFSGLSGYCPSLHLLSKMPWNRY